MKLAMRILVGFLTVVLAGGCAVTPYKDRHLDTISDFKKPPPGKAGIYVYQWKSGILGAARDVDFEIKGLPVISLNTGEYGYLEADPGRYEYKLMGGIAKTYLPVEFEANQNYFFRAVLDAFTDSAFLVADQPEIDEAKKNILSGRYELYSVD